MHLILRNQKVLLDCDVADLYGVKTKEVNQAVKNNPDKFPYGYIFVLDKYEKAEVVKNFDRLNNLKYSTVEPTAFTQRGLYMHSGELMADVIGNNLSTTTAETEIELNFAVVKIRHKIIRKDEK